VSWRQIGKSGRIFLDRPKPTAGCSANGRRRRRSIRIYLHEMGLNTKNLCECKRQLVTNLLSMEQGASMVAIHIRNSAVFMYIFRSFSL
jgi:hypothetical protein